ncbi:MAG: carbon-nitrogen hydrolase family protein [Vicinamibacterales bacterium]
MIIALAAPRVATSVDDALARVRQAIAEAAARHARIVCFPEAYVPGLRGLDFDVPAFDAADEARAIDAVATAARDHRIAAIVGIEHHAPAGRQIAAVVVDGRGEVLGRQVKTQLDPTEHVCYVPGAGRRVFEIDGLRFGIAICHEGFRYPETVRHAAARGAHVVFHPHCAGSDRAGVTLTEWGSTAAPYYERAVMCRALENTIYVASANYAFRYAESATSVIAPSGDCVAWLPYGDAGVLTYDLDPALATGLLARRWAPERNEETE